MDLHRALHGVLRCPGRSREGAPMARGTGVYWASLRGPKSLNMGRAIEPRKKMPLICARRGPASAQRHDVCGGD